MVRAPDVANYWVGSTGLSAAALARRAGVSASTLHRVRSGQVDPSVGTLREIALACGFDFDITTRPLSDRLAAAAVRELVEDGYDAPDDPEVHRWQQRLTRMAGGDSPLDLVVAAASASAPLHRTGAVLQSGEVPLGRLASAGDASKGRWALSGPAGLALPPSDDPAPAVTILWCEDARKVVQLLGDADLRSTHRPDRARIAVIEAEPELFTGSFQRGILRYAAPIQIILDCLAQGGRAAEEALREAKTW
ncbi:MAG: helix-turn-helix transcriptional regulator [Mycobacterium sp.]|nr:helix-turn-helix transcriptional regulator [Mycobacterium sp.]